MIWEVGEKCKKTYKYLNYVEKLLILSSAVAASVSISAFDSLVCFTVGITSSSVEICAIVAGITRYKSIINKKKKKYNKLMLLGKDKLNTIKDLISKALINSCISHDESVSK